jgi:hypothetical protein
MAPTECPLCKNEAPARSRFCNCCGTPLGLDPCAHCGAINGAGALACFNCGGELSARTPSADALLTRAVESSGATVAAAQTEPIATHPPDHSSFLFEKVDRGSDGMATLDGDREAVVDVIHVDADETMKMEAISEAISEARFEPDGLVSEAPHHSGWGPGEPEPPIPEALLAAAVPLPTESFAAGAALEPVDASAPSAAPRSPRRSRMPLLVGGAIAAALALALYRVLSPPSFIEPSPPPLASRETGALENPNETRGAGQADGGGIDAKAAALIASPAVAPSAEVAVQTVPAVAQNAVADGVQPGPAASQAPAPKAEIAARPKAINPAPAAPRSPASLGPCTEAVAALGLCSTEPTQRR